MTISLEKEKKTMMREDIISITLLQDTNDKLGGKM